MKTRLVEKYYTPQQLGWLFEFDAKTIREKAHAGEFGPDVLNLGGTDMRIPASGVHAYEARNRLFPAALPEDQQAPIAARTEGELRRRITEQPRKFW